MTFSAIIIAHEDEHLTNMMLAQMLHCQNHTPNETLVMGSNLDWNKVMTSGLSKNIDCPDKGDWGHDKRRRGLAIAQYDYFGFFNHDDIYSSEYVGEMLYIAHETDADVVLSDWMEGGRQMGAKPIVGHVTAGGFIARTSFARKVGYNHNHYEADGQFIVDLANAGAKIVNQDNPYLYTHL